MAQNDGPAVAVPQEHAASRGGSPQSTALLASVSATIGRFSASEYCRRLAAPGCLVSTKPLVDTCSACSAIR